MSQKSKREAAPESLRTSAADFIGPRVKELCGKQHITKYRLSQMTGLTQTVLANIIKRKTIPTLEKICSAFDISLAQFFANDMNPLDLTSEQRELIETWNELNSDDRERLMKIVRTFQ